MYIISLCIYVLLSRNKIGYLLFKILDIVNVTIVLFIEQENCVQRVLLVAEDAMGALTTHY